jgi:phosphohistidine phosphatase
VKTIYLLRHAKTEPGNSAIVDRDRRLTERGKADALAASELISEKQWVIDIALSSPSVRTRETVQAINQGQEKKLVIDYPDTLYLANYSDIIRLLQQLPDHLSSVLLVGHNPGIHQCALMLAGSGDRRAMEDIELKFPPCALAVLQCDIARWEMLVPQCGHLVGYWDQY